MRKIVTHSTHSPLPTRINDWCAFYEGEEEAGSYGYGATPEAAIDDFIENCQEEHDERLDPPINLLDAVNQFRKEAATVPLTLDVVTDFICALVAASSLDSVREGSEHQMAAAE
jgi:hypothetical protein